MIGISQIATRVDSLLQNEQDNRMFVTETLRKNALEILDEKFMHYLYPSGKASCWTALRVGEVALGAVLNFAKQPIGINILESTKRNVNSDLGEMELVKQIWDTAKKKTAKLEILQLYKFITILKTKDLKTAVAYLHISEDTLV